MRFAVAVLMLAAGLVLVPPPPANAVEMSTQYPTIEVEPGQSVTFDLDLRSKSGERVALSVTDAPKGWQVSLRGGGSHIGAVYVAPKSSPSVEVEVQVPAKATPGTHTVEVAASAPSGKTSLTLQLNVVQQTRGAFALTAEFPRLEGSSDDTYSFDVTLHNRTAQKATFGLSTAGPPGWQVTASPALESKAAAVKVDAGSTASITVEADPPDSVSAGKYKVGVRAKGEGTTLQTTFTVKVSGSPELTLETTSQRLNASGSAGETTDIQFVVRNTGSAPLKDVSLSATPPTDWEVSFEPEKVPAVPAGKAKTVTAHVTPTGDAIAGDYMVTFSASGAKTNDSADLRYSVETSGWWGLIGILVIAAAIIGLLWMFRRFGRR